MPTTLPSIQDVLDSAERERRRLSGLPYESVNQAAVRHGQFAGTVPQGNPQEFTDLLDFSSNPQETLAKINSSKFYSTQTGLGFGEVMANYDTVAKAYWGNARTPISDWAAITDSFNDGMLTFKLGNAWAKARDEGMTPELQKQIDELELARPPSDKLQRSLPITALKLAAGSVPYSVAGLAGSVPGALLSLAFPEASLLAAGLFTVARTVGSMAATQGSMGGLEYRDMIKAGMNPEIAAMGSRVSGLLQAAVESDQIMGLLPTDAAKHSLFAAAKGVLEKGVLKGTWRNPLTQFAARNASRAIGEGTEEAAQQAVSFAVSEIVRQASNSKDGKDIPAATWDEISKSLVDNFVGGALASLPMGALGEPISIAHDVQKYGEFKATESLRLRTEEKAKKVAEGASGPGTPPASSPGASPLPAPAKPLTFKDYASSEPEADGSIRTELRGAADPKSKVASVQAGYTWNPDSGTVNVEKVTVDKKLRKDDPAEANAQTVAVLQELRAKYPEAVIAWKPKTAADKLIEQSLLADNPRFFEADHASGKVEAPVSAREQIKADFAFDTPEKADVALALLDEMGASEGLTGVQWKDKYISAIKREEITTAGGVAQAADSTAAKDLGLTTFFHTGTGEQIDPARVREFQGMVKAIVTLAPTADFHTVLHEVFHVKERLGLTDVQKAGLEQAIGKKYDEMTYDDMELAADGWEQYHRTGVAPSPEQKDLFDSIARIMTKIVGSLRAQKVKLTPEFTRFYDSLLGTSPVMAASHVQAEAYQASAVQGPAPAMKAKGPAPNPPKSPEAARAAKANERQQARKGKGLAQPRDASTHPDELGTRKPTGKNATESPVIDLPLVDHNLILASPKLSEQAAKVIQQYVNHKTTGGTAKQEIEAFIAHVSENLRWIYNQVDPAIRNRSKLWYDGANAIINRWAPKYGTTWAQNAGVLAVLSPQKDWFQNVSIAERVLDFMTSPDDFAWDDAMTERADRTQKDPKTKAMVPSVFKNANNREVFDAINGKAFSELDTPFRKAMFLRLWHESHSTNNYRVVTPEGSFLGPAQNIGGAESNLVWSDFEALAKAVSIIEDGSLENISNRIGNEHKVRNFYNNILVPMSPRGHTTMDTHAIAAGLLRPLGGSAMEVSHNFGTSSPGTTNPSSDINLGVNGIYAIYNEAYQRAAKSEGVLPREMQSITWEAVRGLFSDSLKRNKATVAQIHEVWDTYRRGEIDADTARERTRDIAGGFTPPEWAIPGRGGNGQTQDASYAGPLSGSAVPRRLRGGPGNRSGYSRDIPPRSLAQPDDRGRVLRGSNGEGSRSRDSKDDGRRRADLQQAFNGAHGLDPDTESIAAVHARPGGTTVLELNPGLTSDIYHDVLDRLRSANPMGIQVSLKDAADYKGMRLFMSSDGTAVAALDGQDMVSVCSEKRPDGTTAMPELIRTIVEQGAKTADCYGSYLPYYYSKFGFQPVARLPWSPEVWKEYADAEVKAGRFKAEDVTPAGLFAKWGGQVGYYFVVHTGDTAAFDTLSDADVARVPLVDDWDRGVAAQQAALAQAPEPVVTASPRGLAAPTDETAEIARSFATYAEFVAAYNAGHELAPDYTAADRETFLRTAWKQAHATTEGSSVVSSANADKAFLAELASDDYSGVKDFLAALGSVIQLDRKKGLKNIDPVDVAALKVADGKAMTDAGLKTVYRTIAANAAKYRDRYAILTGDAAMAAQLTAEREGTSPAGPVDFASPLGKVSLKSVLSRLRAAALEIDDPELRELYGDGKVAYGQAIEDAKGLGDEIKQLQAELDAAHTSLLEWRGKFTPGERDINTRNKARRLVKADLAKAKVALDYAKKRASGVEAAQAAYDTLKARAAGLQAEIRVMTKALPTGATIKDVAFDAARQANRAAIQKLEAKLAEAKLKREARNLAMALAKAITAPVAKATDFRIKQQIWEIQKVIDAKFRRPPQGFSWEGLKALFHEAPDLSKILPQEVLDRLDKRPLNLWTIAELQDLKERVDLLREKGRQMLAEKHLAKKTDRMEWQRVLNETLRSSGKYTEAAMYGSAEFIKAQGDDNSTFRKWDRSLSTMARIARTLDNGHEKGFFYEVLVKKERDAYSAEKLNYDRRWSAIEAEMKRLKVTAASLYEGQVKVGDWTISRADAIGVYIGLQDADTAAKIIYGNMIPDPNVRSDLSVDIDALGLENLKKAEAAAQQLTEPERQFAQFLIDDATREFDRLREAAYKLENQEPPRVAIYFPNECKSRSGEGTLKDQMKQDLLQRTPQIAAKTSRNMVIERIKIGDRHQLPITLDALGVYHRGIERQEHYIAYADFIRDSNLLIQNEHTASGLRYTVRQTHGQGVLDYIDGWLSEAANPKAYTDYQKNLEGFDQVFRALRGPLGTAYLGLRASTAFKQLITSPLPYFAYSGTHLVTSMVGNLNLAQYLKNVKIAKEKSAFIRDRQMSTTVAMMKEYAASPGISKIQKGTASIAFKLIEASDMWAVVSGWMSVYERTLVAERAKGKTGPALEKAAVDEADRVTIECQPTGRKADSSPAFKSTSEVQKFLLQFQGPLNTVYNQLFHDVPDNIRDGHVGRAAAIIGGYLATGAILSIIAMPRKDDDDEKKRLRYLLAGALRQPLDSIPLLGGAAADSVEALVTGDRRFRGTTDAFPGLSKILTGTGGMMAAPDQEAFLKNLIAFAEGSGMVAGIPTSALKEYYRVLFEGDLGALLGRPKK